MTDTEFAKTHLKEHLSSLIVTPIAEGFWSIHSSAKEMCERNNQPDQILRTFQNMLTKIPDWSDATLTTEVERIEKVTKCDYLDDLIMGVFISYMKSFASLQYTGQSKEVEINFERPSLSKFVHEIYLHSARKLWQTAYLMNTAVSTEAHARNRQEVEKIISACLEQVVRGFLPWQSIAKKYFSTNEPSDFVKPVEPEAEPEAEPEPEEQKVQPTTKSVKFNDDSEDEEPPKLLMSEEDATLDLPEEEVDPMVELEIKASETLVLNL
jgi:hypothetical protein